MAAPLFRDLPPLAPRPALVVFVLGLAGLVVDLFVRPVSTEGFLLILLAASPFLLELARQQPRAADETVGRPEAGKAAAPAAQAAPKGEAPAAAAVPDRARQAAPRPAPTRPAPAAAERQPSAPPPRPAPRPQPDQVRPGGQRPAARGEDAERADPREAAKLL